MIKVLAYILAAPFVVVTLNRSLYYFIIAVSPASERLPDGASFGAAILTTITLIAFIVYVVIAPRG